MGVAIHGGTSSGSAGRIDLTDQMKSFTGHFLVYGHDLELTIKIQEGKDRKNLGFSPVARGFKLIFGNLWLSCRQSWCSFHFVGSSNI